MTAFSTVCRSMIFILFAATEASRPQMFALLMEPYAMVQVPLLLQQHRTVVANFVPGKFGLHRRNPWQPHAEPRLKTTDIA